VIRMELVDQKRCPIIRCAGCGERITDPRMAGVVWGSGDSTDTAPSAVTILCKTNHCLMRPPWRHLPWEQLDIWLVHLTDNARMTRPVWRQARQLAGELEAMFG
jgi:hypothetical protein